MKNKLLSAWIVIGLFVVLFGSKNIVLASAERLPEAASPPLGAWVAVPSPTTQRLISISMTSATDGWAVGDNEVILHWNGNSWAQIAGPPAFTNDLTSVSAVSTNDAWAVGYYENDMIRWNGSSWISVTPPFPYTMARAVSAIDSNNAWFAEGYMVCTQSGCTDYGYIHHWNGSAWQTIGNTSDEPISIDMVSATEGWVVGTKTIPENPSQSIIKHWDGVSWANVNHPNVNVAWEISALNAAEAWVIGGNSLSILLHWDKGQWVQFASPVSYLGGIDMVASSDVWAVGAYGEIIHWDGSVWSQVSSPVTTALEDIDMVSAYEGWAVGANGTILHYLFTPTLTINYNTGKPGSFFTLTGTGFPAGSTATLAANSHAIGTIPTDSMGNLACIIDTSQADEGHYVVTATINPSASTTFNLDINEPLRLQEGSGTIFNVPGGIAYTHIVYLPHVR